jgi:cytochrome c oxidase cbb3-type subunit 3
MRVAYMRTLFLVLASTALLLHVTGRPGAAARLPQGGSTQAAKMKNPVANTPESVTAGKRVYQRMCARCHGPEGKGDGGGGGIPSDLTDEQWDHGSTDGEIFTSIHDGTSKEMEGYAERISDTDIWNLVNFIRSIGPQPKP